MQIPQLAEVGKLQKTHGVNGELQVHWDSQILFETDHLESVFLLMEGIPIPFFVERVRSETHSSCIIKLDEVDSIEQAAPLVGADVLVPADLLVDDTKSSDHDSPFEGLVGYTLLSQAGAMVGKIVAFENYSGNTVFTVEHSGGREVIVPVTSDLIISLDEETKTLVIRISDGLLDIFLE